jgi:hypothetical protein
MMKKSEDELDYIAERHWEYHSASGEILSIPVRLSKPKQGVHGKLWESRLLIHWPDGTIIQRRAIGTDSVDALIQLIELFRIECKNLSSAMGDTLRFGADSSLFGYPI